MKKIIISLLLCFFGFLSVYADNMPPLKYKNIKNKSKISYNETTGTWSYNKSGENYFTKTKGFGVFYDYLNSDKSFAFSTNCEYEFIYNDSLIGYSNRDMKFYDITYANGGLSKRPLSVDEVEKIFPEYKVIPFSEFSDKTNSLKIKKQSSPLKILLFNDTNDNYDGYAFSTGNAKIEQYDLRGFVTVHKPGMVQFSKSKELNKNQWYIILVR